MQGYDLDDTLAATEFQNAGVRGLVNVFKSAKVIYKPTEDFVVVTARPHRTAEQRQATADWLRTNQPHFKAIYYVNGSEKEVAQGKAQTIRRLRLTDYTDNNDTILGYLADLVPTVRLWKLSGGTRKRFSKPAA